MFQLHKELYVFLAQEGHKMVATFEDTFRLAKLSYLSPIFENTNQLNLSMQGKGCAIFEVARKVQAFKFKLKLWQSNVSKWNFSDFECLNNFIKTRNW